MRAEGTDDGGADMGADRGERPRGGPGVPRGRKAEGRGTEGRGAEGRYYTITLLIILALIYVIL